jgi:hypothetical protein
MDEREFCKLVKETVAKYSNSRVSDRVSGSQITPDDVYIVWMCKTLQNSKALASTTLFDGMYYEVTYNGDRREIYFDAYIKLENRRIPVETNK